MSHDPSYRAELAWFTYNLDRTRETWVLLEESRSVSGAAARGMVYLGYQFD